MEGHFSTKIVMLQKLNINVTDCLETTVYHISQRIYQCKIMSILISFKDQG